MEDGLKEMTVYIARRHNMVAQYINTRMIMELCLEATAWSGAWVTKQWWEQEGMGLKETRTAEYEERTGGADGGATGTEYTQRG